MVQETRGWHEGRRETFSQRLKEEAEDYRYFPEPDLPPLHIAPEWVAQIKVDLPDLPQTKIARYTAEWGLTEYEAQVVTEEWAVAEWLETAVAAGGDPKTVVNWLINNLFSLMNEHKQPIAAINIRPADLVDLLKLVDNETISYSAAKTVLAEMFHSGQTAAAIIDTQGLAQISDEATLLQIVNQIISAHPDQVNAYKEGKTQLKGWFVGQVMKATQGKANPALVNQLLHQALS